MCCRMNVVWFWLYDFVDEIGECVCGGEWCFLVVGDDGLCDMVWLLFFVELIDDIGKVVFGGLCYYVGCGWFNLFYLYVEWVVEMKWEVVFCLIELYWGYVDIYYDVVDGVDVLCCVDFGKIGELIFD